MTSVSVKQLAFVFRRAPHGSIFVQEFLDIALIAGAFDQKAELYFIDQGVQALRQHQHPEGAGLKHIAPLFEALDVYGIEQLFVDRGSLNKRGLQASELIVPVCIKDRGQIMRQLQAADHVFSC